MVTADRKQLMERSIYCFLQQDYPNKELVVIDDGNQDVSEVLQLLPASQLNYNRLEKKPENTLGKLRNISLEKARGDFLAQWDDDDWYHPRRLSLQAEYLLKGNDACCLSGALMHLDEEAFMHHPYVGFLPDGIPGSIMHRRDSEIRYPHTRKAEDTDYLHEWRQKEYSQLPKEYSYLFIRCYHGDNTWEKNHFLRRIRNNPKDAILFGWHKYIKGNLFEHPRFNLSQTEEESFLLYLEASQKLDLISL